MPKASRKELRKSLFKKGSDARSEAKKNAKEKHQEIESSKPPPKKRFILFVGNLPYDVTEEQISTHFKQCNVSSLRLRPKGICFLEFTGPTAAQNLNHALKFHHSTLGNRRINVEFSAGGGGNSENRRQKIKQKNEMYQEEVRRNTEIKPKPVKAVKVNDETKAEAAKKGINPARLAALSKGN